MADLSDYANQLLMQYMTPEKPDFSKGDPYVGFQSVLDPISQIAIGADPNEHGTGERAALSFISGLLGGGFEGLSDDYQSRAKKSYFDVALGKADQADIDMLDGDLFSSAEQAKSIFDMAKVDEAKNLESARSSEIFKAMLSDPYKAKRGLEMMGQTMEGKAEPIAKLPEAIPEGAEPIATKPVTVGPKELSLTDQYDQFMTQTGGNEGLTEKLIQRGLDQPKELLGIEDSLRKELAAKKEILEFGDIKKQLNVLALASLDPRSSADLDYIYGIAKILDPGAVVRESDAGMVIESQSIPASTLGYINKLAKGESALDRPALFDLAKRHYDTRSAGVTALFDRYEGLAKKRGVSNPADILPFARDTISFTLPELATQPAKGNTDPDRQRALVENQMKLLTQKRKGGGMLSPKEQAFVDEVRKMAGGR